LGGFASIETLRVRIILFLFAISFDKLNRLNVKNLKLQINYYTS
jgi:hypothetical protein